MKEIYLPDVIGAGYASFWADKSFFQVIKGGRGSKKSRTMGLRSIYRIMKYPLSNMVVVRKVGNTHKDSTYAELKWAVHRLGVDHLWTFKVSPLEAVYNPTGQKILFRGFDDPLKLTSLAVDVGYLCWAWIEEAFEIEEESDFNTFAEGIRGELPEPLFKQITLTFNPWRSGHWTKARFFDQEQPDTFTLTTTHKCNEFLDQADHDKIEELKITDPDRYKVVGLGEYGIPGGAFFNEFRESIHVIEPFDIPDDWVRFRCMDYGLDMFACYFAAMDSQKNLYIYKEIYESDLIVSQACKLMQSYTSEEIRSTFAPPDLWNRSSATGKSTADIFNEYGETLVIAKNGRIPGWASVKEWLKVYDVKDEQTGEIVRSSALKITSNCKNLIRCLPQVQHDDKKPNDVATEPHELTHSVDALRYLCSMFIVPNVVHALRPLPSIFNFLEDTEEEYLDSSFIAYGMK